MFAYFTARSTDQINGRTGGAAGGDQVIYQQNALTRFDRIGVDFHGVGAIFQIIFLADGFPRQFTFFTHGHKTNTQLVGDCTAKDKATGFDPGDLVDPDASMGLHQFVNGMRIWRIHQAQIFTRVRGLGRGRHGLRQFDVGGEIRFARKRDLVFTGIRQHVKFV